MLQFGAVALPVNVSAGAARMSSQRLSGIKHCTARLSREDPIRLAYCSFTDKLDCDCSGECRNPDLYNESRRREM